MMQIEAMCKPGSYGRGRDIVVKGLHCCSRHSFPDRASHRVRLSSPGQVLEVKPERHPNDDEEENAYSAKASSLTIIRAVFSL